MSNIFLSTAFIFLASKQADCLDEEGKKPVDDCPNEVYGFKPASFVANIAVISSVLSCVLMPLLGAVIDYTVHRRTVGAGAAALMIVIQALQVWLNVDTWFPMAVLQAFTGFVYQIEVLATYAYLPDMARMLGEEAMTRCT